MTHRSGSIWDLNSNIGRLNSRALTCEVDVMHPERGLCNTAVDGVAIHAAMLVISREFDDNSQQEIGGKNWPAALADAYVRGNDLVASYSPSGDWPYAPQIYWRAETLESMRPLLSSLSVLISVQTHLLDTYPEISITTRMAAQDLFEVTAPVVDDTPSNVVRIDSVQRLFAGPNPRCLVWRLRNQNISYVEIMPGSDHRELVVERREDGTAQARWRVFADFLEKGVIRRARLQSGFVPRENDLEIAAACCRSIERQPLPLTA